MNPACKIAEYKHRTTRTSKWNGIIFRAKADTGASTHYIKPEDKGCLMNVHEDSGPTITCPNLQILRSKEAGYLPISAEVTAAGRKARIVPELRSLSLILVGQLADNGYKAHIDKKLKL